MTSRQARTLRREQERKAAKLAYKAAKATAQPIGFVSQNDPESVVADPTPAQSTCAEINRANGRRSTGPRTLERKLASSRNSLLDDAAVLSEPKTQEKTEKRSGLASGQLIIPGEDPAAFDALLADLFNEHQPASPTEQLLVNEMAQSYWLEQRAIALQNGCFSDTGVDEKRLALFLRYETTHHRAFYKALTTLTRLQTQRRKIGNGFVSHRARETATPNGFVSQNHPPTGPEPGFVSQNEPAEPFDSNQTISEAA